jgi:cystathionine beta-synthase
LILAKVETFNPGNSTKDRMAMKMIDDAEADGRLQPGGTIIEGTSEYRNGISTSSIIRGYKLICVISDKTSKKNGYLESCWCKSCCPTDVEPTDPRSYIQFQRLASETPNSWYVVR